MSKPNQLWRATGLVAAAGAMAWLWHRTDVVQAAGALHAVGGAFLWLLVPYALATALYAIPWGLLLSTQHRPGWGVVVASRFAAAAVNVVLPSGLFGEPMRLRAVAPASRRLAGEALVWDRALYLVSSALFLLATMWGGGARLGGRPFVAAGLASALGYVAVATGLVGASRTQRLRRWTERWFDRRELAMRPSLPAASGGLAIHFVARLAAAGELWLGAHLLGVTLGAEAWLFVASACVLSAAALPMVPGQVGVQEAALAAAMGVVGAPPEIGLALGLLVRLRQLVFVALGFLLGASLSAPTSAPES